MTEKILIIDQCRHCPFGVSRPFPTSSYIELKCAREQRLVSRCTTQWAQIQIPEWCPLSDAEEGSKS